MSTTLDRAVDFLTRSLAEIEAEEVDAAIREHVQRPGVVCDPEDFGQHVVAVDSFDQTPIYGSCSTDCSLL